MFSDSQIIDILSNLKKVASCFEYKIGQFKINIFLDQIQDHIEFGPNDKITDHEIFDVHLFELKKYIKYSGYHSISPRRFLEKVIAKIDCYVFDEGIFNQLYKDYEDFLNTKERIKYLTRTSEIIRNVVQHFQGY